MKSDRLSDAGVPEGSPHAPKGGVGERIERISAGGVRRSFTVHVALSGSGNNRLRTAIEKCRGAGRAGATVRWRAALGEGVIWGVYSTSAHVSLGPKSGTKSRRANMDGIGQNAEELNVSKFSPLWLSERTSMRPAATSLMGQGTKSLRDSCGSGLVLRAVRKGEIVGSGESALC